MNCEVIEVFNKIEMRFKISILWLIAFICLWSAFRISFPIKAMKHQLDKIEQSIGNENWQQASNYTTQFTNTYNSKRFLIHMNNSTEILTTFEHTIGQLETTVKYNEKSALEFVGALRSSLDLVAKPFAGP